MLPARWTLMLALALTACGAAPGGGQAVPAPTPAPTSGPTGSPSAGSAVRETAVAVVARGDGRLAVVPGTGRRVGTGSLQTYAVEVEGGLGLDVDAFTRSVEQTLADPRSWTADGRRALQRVDGPADVRVALASPATADRLCAPLRTNGHYSCASGDRAVLNARRWLTGATAYAGRLQDYRDYLVNHEVGHVLGARHTGCPAEGQVAPVMLQQTLGLDGCLPGPWPHP